MPERSPWTFHVTTRRRRWSGGSRSTGAHLPGGGPSGAPSGVPSGARRGYPARAEGLRVGTSTIRISGKAGCGGHRMSQEGSAGFEQASADAARLASELAEIRKQLTELREQNAKFLATDPVTGKGS